MSPVVTEADMRWRLEDDGGELERDGAVLQAQLEWDSADAGIIDSTVGNYR